MTELIVIGAGLSGLMAAHTAATAGLKTKVVAKGWGALHWSAGTIDLFGYATGADTAGIDRPLEHIADLAATNPGHPYALLGVEQVTAALDSFTALVEKRGLPYVGATAANEAKTGDNLRLPSPVGAARPTFLAPAAQIAGDLARPEPMLIVGFEGLRDFYPALIAENLNKQGIQARALLLPHELLTDRRDANTIQLAHELDDPARRARIGEALRGLVQPGERIGLPAILGMDAHAALMAEWQSTLDAPIFEIPTLPPSVPGVRLFKALRDELEALGVRVEAGMAVTAADSGPGTNGDGGSSAAIIRWVASETSARPLKHRAEKFLLATGGVLGGGFNSDHTGRVWETIFDLPLTVPQARSGWFRPRFLDERGHPVFQGGVKVNSALQPVDGDGNLCYANLWAAGGALGGCDSIVERSLEGVALASGLAVGRKMMSKD